MTTIYSKAGTDAAISGAVAELAAGAYPVQQVALTGNLAYALPVDAPTDQVVGVVFTQDAAGGHTVTYGGSPVTVDTTAGASTLVEFFHDGTGWEARVLAATTPPALGTAAAADSEDFATASQGAAIDRRTARENAARWEIDADPTLARIDNTGLRVTDGALCATTPGTLGIASWIQWRRPDRDFRASARIRATKGTAGSESWIGLAVAGDSTPPTTSSVMTGVGYVAGTGFCFVRKNYAGGVPIGILADASVVDGAEYDVSMVVSWSLPLASGFSSYSISARIRDLNGVDVALGAQGPTFADFNPSHFAVGTNIGPAGSMSRIILTDHPTARIGVRTYNSDHRYYPGNLVEKVGLHVPENPNGKLVVAMHGLNDTANYAGWVLGALKPTWAALCDAGFTVAIPDMGGNLWGNGTARAMLASLVAQLRSKYDLDDDLFLHGNSMGGAAALVTISQGTFRGHVRAAYLAEPTCDMSARWSEQATMQAAYGTLDALAAVDPVLQPNSAFSGTPLLFVASPQDASAVKAVHTDAMRAKLGTSVPNYLVTASGGHMDASHFRPRDTVNFFKANL